jgi:hypothetical protein
MTATPSGSHCLLMNDGTATPSFIADVEGEYVLTLETDGGLLGTVSVMAEAREVHPAHPDHPMHPDHPTHPDHPVHPTPPKP